MFARRKTSCPDCPVQQTFETGEGTITRMKDGTVKTIPLKRDGETVAVVNITT